MTLWLFFGGFQRTEHNRSPTKSGLLVQWHCIFSGSFEPQRIVIIRNKSFVYGLDTGSFLMMTAGLSPRSKIVLECVSAVNDFFILDVIVLIQLVVTIWRSWSYWRSIYGVVVLIYVFIPSFWYRTIPLSMVDAKWYIVADF